LFQLACVRAKLIARAQTVSPRLVCQEAAFRQYRLAAIC
jgi:hypothetical protein